MFCFFSIYRLQGPTYIYNFFEPRVTPNNVRRSGTEARLTFNTSSFIHNSSYIISHIWNQLPHDAKIAPSLAQFRLQIKNVSLKRLPILYLYMIYLSTDYLVISLYVLLSITIISLLFIVIFLILLFSIYNRAFAT